MKRSLTATDPMPWGEFKGTPMGELPLTYLDFLLRQPWLRDWPAIHGYVTSRKDEVIAARPKIEAPKDLDTFDDYLKWARK